MALGLGSSLPKSDYTFFGISFTFLSSQYTLSLAVGLG